jgi:glucose-6-phosphate isomerase
MMSTQALDRNWQRFCRKRQAFTHLGLTLDLSRSGLQDEPALALSPACDYALQAMAALEAGAIANRDEDRAVGHYWLRAPELAPTPELVNAIGGAVDAVESFARAVHDGSVRGTGGPFEHVVHVGIGGSALGAQLLCEATATTQDRLTVHFLENADPDAITALLARFAPALNRSLVSVVSKSGVTPTPMHVAGAIEAAYARAGLDFARHAVATTASGTPLDRRAGAERWLAQFPLWDWVGGRTSVTSPVGLLPAALQGADIRAFLGGAAAMDELTREADPSTNPAALLAHVWHQLGEGTGRRSLVVLPYRDRLALLPRHLQQLVMESLGKRFNRAGQEVRQGLTVYGNKGSTDQHAYVQQLREGPDDFFVTFVGVHEDARDPIDIGAGVTLGDYLAASLEGTRDALYGEGRRSVLIELAAVTERSLGALIALFERTVGLYAELIDVNAYHQPSVDKHAAAGTLAVQRSVLECVAELSEPLTAPEIACEIGQPERAETVFKVLERLARLPGRGVIASGGDDPATIRFARAGVP